MKVYIAEQSQIIQLNQVVILTRDVRQMVCKTITIHLDTAKNNIDPERVAFIVKEKMHWMGHIFFSHDILTAKCSYAGSVRLAVDKILNEQNIQCTRINIAKVEILI